MPFSNQIKLINASQFKRVPWKNGKGETIELAINNNGSMAQFDWRLSMAKVSENGIFSTFDNITRNLILIEGEHLALHHEKTLVEDEHGLSTLKAEPKTDELTQLLSYATFYGGTPTQGEVKKGAIVDFNVMHNADVYRASVNTYLLPSTVKLSESELTFIFQVPTSDVFSMAEDENSAQLSFTVEQLSSEKALAVNAGDLVRLCDVKNGQFTIQGERLIVVTFDKR